MGRVVFGYADEIFSLGREMLNTVKHQAGARPMRFRVGVADSVPKVIAYEIIRPVFQMRPPVQMVCREGKVAALLALLAAQRLDIVLADEPASSAVNLKNFNHPLGASDVICRRGVGAKAAQKLSAFLARRARAAPGGEHGLSRSARDLVRFPRGIRPRLVTEFEDTALMHPAAIDGIGFVPVHRVIAKRAAQLYGWQTVGWASDCLGQFYTINAQRRLKHPAIVAITEHAQSRLFAFEAVQTLAATAPALRRA